MSMKRGRGTIPGGISVSAAGGFREFEHRRERLGRRVDPAAVMAGGAVVHGRRCDRRRTAHPAGIWRPRCRRKRRRPREAPRRNSRHTKPPATGDPIAHCLCWPAQARGLFLELKPFSVHLNRHRSVPNPACTQKRGRTIGTATLLHYSKKWNCLLCQGVGGFLKGQIKTLN